MWAEVAKQGGFGSSKFDKLDIKSEESEKKEEIVKPQEDITPEPLPKDSEK